MIYASRHELEARSRAASSIKNVLIYHSIAFTLHFLEIFFSETIIQVEALYVKLEEDGTELNEGIRELGERRIEVFLIAMSSAKHVFVIFLEKTYVAQAVVVVGPSLLAVFIFYSGSIVAAFPAHCCQARAFPAHKFSKILPGGARVSGIYDGGATPVSKRPADGEVSP